MPRLSGINAQAVKLIALLTIVGSLLGCSRQPAAPQPERGNSATPQASIPVADRPPAALAQIGDSAKALFDAAYASDWDTAADWMRSINESASALPTTLPKADVVVQLHSRLDGVRDHIAERQRTETMDDANAITHLVADLSAQFQTPVPYEAVLLGYYGRQLELGIAQGRPPVLSRAATDLRSAWNRLEPTIERRGRIDDARRFTDIVVQLERARRPADFVAPARAELAEADRIETLFRSPS